MKKSEVAQVYKGTDEKSWQELLDDLRPKGKWIYDSDHSITIDMYKCSICGCDGHTHFKFCPQCGADMKIQNISSDSGIQEFDKKFADLIVFNDQPQRQLKSSDVHEDV